MENKKIIKKEFDLAGKKLSLETGKLATLTNMSVKASYGDTTVLVTVVSGDYNADIDYFLKNQFLRRRSQCGHCHNLGNSSGK